MERKFSCTQPAREGEGVGLMRRSTIGYQTEQLDRMDYVIGEIVLQTNFKMSAFVAACNQYPQIKDETKLINEIFLKPHFVHDLVRFLMAPAKMVAKFALAAEEARNYVTTIAAFLRENYQFYEYYFLSLERGILGLDGWFQFLSDTQAPSFYTSLGYLADVFVPFVKYEFSTSSRVTEYFEKHNPERGILLIDHFPELLLGRLIQATQYQAIFKVLLNLVLVSLQEQEWKKSLGLLKALCLSGISLGATLDSHVDNLFMMVREVGNNIEKDVHNTIFAFTDAFVQTDLVGACITRITSLFQSSESMRNGGLLTFEEEWAVEGNLKLLGEIINIYSQLRTNGIDHSAGQMVKLKNSILKIYQSFGSILKLLRTAQSRSLNFSSGQNIRAVAPYRYEFLNLLRTSLVLVKQHGEAFPEVKPNLDKSEILQFLTRCLSENRWNSIVHCLIEKIVCLMINTEFFKTRSNSIRRFLSFLVQAFSNKKYMFLNSAKMINQGDIHSLYCISRKITVELDRMPAIVDSTNEFDFWKDFVLKVLQKYEHFSERRSSQVEWEEEDRDREREKEAGDFRVEIDQVALIKEIVKKIEVNKKWSFKRDDKATIYRIGSASELKKKQRNSIKGEKVTTSGPHSRFRVSVNEQTLKPFVERLAKQPAVISTGSKKALSINEQELQVSVSNSNSEQSAVPLMSAHSDADRLEQQGSESKKMTQSGW